MSPDASGEHKMRNWYNCTDMCTEELRNSLHQTANKFFIAQHCLDRLDGWWFRDVLLDDPIALAKPMAAFSRLAVCCLSGWRFRSLQWWHAASRNHFAQANREHSLEALLKRGSLEAPTTRRRRCGARRCGADDAAQMILPTMRRADDAAC